MITIPLAQDAENEAQQWTRLFDGERDWLPWALSQLGLPTVDEILETADD